MPIMDVYNQNREKVSTLDLPEDIFAVEVKEHLFHAVVRQQLAARRAGTHKTKSRAEVSGGGRKPFRQKGTGRARAGTTRAAQWRGGGIVFGPVVRDHSIKVTKKVRRSALKSALSRRVEESAVTVFDDFRMEEIKTKSFRQVMDRFEVDELLLIIADADDTVMKSAKNLPKVKVLPVAGLNVYDILNHRNLAVTTAAVDSIVRRLEG